MKKIIHTIVAFTVATLSYSAMAQYPERLGLPGDNLNLYAVMDLFRQSETLEGFERDLNNQDNTINNLDLNGDGYVDYITVTDYPDGNVHNIVLRVAINAMEQQDVAVFTVYRNNTDQVFIQLTGDEALYGANYIIEPGDQQAYAGTPNPGYTGQTSVVVTRTRVGPPPPISVYAWPLISFIYMPTYVVWHSPWYYGYYPVYWRPWRPYYWHYYYGYHYNHYYPVHYTIVNVHRYNIYNVYYSSTRSVSAIVNGNINRGVYRATYSRPDTREQGEARYMARNAAQNNRSVANTNNNRSAARTANSTRVSTTPAKQNTQPVAVRKTATTQPAAIRKTTSTQPVRSTTARAVTNRQTTNVQTSRNNTASSFTTRQSTSVQSAAKAAPPSVNQRSTNTMSRSAASSQPKATASANRSAPKAASSSASRSAGSVSKSSNSAAGRSVGNARR